MIVQIRIDDRLIHGQVALLWTKELNTRGIIVANDKAASDEALAATLKMACPANQRLLVKSVEDSVRVINDPRARGMRIFALTNCVRDALRLVERCPGLIGAVNMANVGRFDGADPRSKVKVVNTVTLTADELEAAKRLCERDVPVYSQVAPDNAKTPIADIVGKL